MLLTNFEMGQFPSRTTSDEVFSCSGKDLLVPGRRPSTLQDSIESVPSRDLKDSNQKQLILSESRVLLVLFFGGPGSSITSIRPSIKVNPQVMSSKGNCFQKYPKNLSDSYNRLYGSFGAPETSLNIVFPASSAPPHSLTKHLRPPEFESRKGWLGKQASRKLKGPRSTVESCRRSL